MIKNYILENLPKTLRYNTEDEGTLLGLPYTYNVPCINDMFQEMYYWDTYFTNVGLIELGKLEQARNNIDDILYLINKLGFMPNGNRTYYCDRSQPPFAHLMVKDIYNCYGDKEWLNKAFIALKKEYDFWQTNRIAENGLNFYGGNNELDDWHREHLLADFFKRCGMNFTVAQEEKQRIAQTVYTFVESGWDCSNRFETDGYSYNPICLNSLLYGMETNMQTFSGILQNGEENIWRNRAEKRKELMNKYMLNPENGLYMDWNFREKRFSPVLSAASVYPIFTGLSETGEKEKGLLHRLMLPFGVSASLNENIKFPKMQWDYPIVWPPLQLISYKGCENYGFSQTAHSIAEKYIKLSEKVFAETGELWEKYNGLDGTVANNEYNAPPVIGWSAMTYIYFKNRIK